MRPNLTGTQRRRRAGYTKNIAHQLAHQTAGFNIGFDLASTELGQRGSFSMDLVQQGSTVGGKPVTLQMLGWLTEWLGRDLQQKGLSRDWVTSARVDVMYELQGRHYALVSTATVITADSSATVTIHNAQLPFRPNAK